MSETPSAIREKISQDIKVAMKAGEAFRRDTLRMLHSALKQVEVDERRVLSDEDVIGILKKAYKQREEAATQYKQANRDDLYEKEWGEMQIILEYLPKQLDDAQLEEALKKIIAEVGASGAKDLGKVMGNATKALGSVADGKRIAAMAKSLLA